MYIKNYNGNTCRRWTDASETCYKNKCICSKCILKDTCKNIIPKYGKPPMKWNVLELYAKFEKPKDYD